ncbi:low affinity iron permease family protein [Emticicia sp. C21]|uniref:low affinity iron permease family protein n=1 Tax=Emticicia sp. C21 TaxID=2302915 RepID=UPI000E342B63|nr:low affinity iron permease family protein [Emticicia sp. C21]RFS16143.1 low affinity iron permease family protein [Emticicia sp. C21]
MKKKKKGILGFFDRFSKKVTKATGSPYAFVSAFIVIIIWAVSGPLFDFSDTWQLVINTGTTIITFMMVFIIQQSQNKDTVALQLKLNELIASSDKASNRLIDIEDLTEEELEKAKAFYRKLADLAEKEDDAFVSHSIEEATQKHEEKSSTQRRPKATDNKKEESNKKEATKATT